MPKTCTCGEPPYKTKSLSTLGAQENLVSGIVLQFCPNTGCIYAMLMFLRAGLPMNSILQWFSY